MHEQLCVMCWLRALGMDLDVTASIITAAWQAGAAAQLARVAPALPPGVIVAQLRAGPPHTSPDALARMFDYVRELEALPPSPDVAEAMGHDGH